MHEKRIRRKHISTSSVYSHGRGKTTKQVQTACSPRGLEWLLGMPSHARLVINLGTERKRANVIFYGYRNTQ